MKDGTKFGIGLGIGLIAGAATGYYLTSDEGKKMRKEAGKKWDNMEKKSRKILDEKTGEISENLQGFLHRVESQIKSLVERMERAEKKSSSVARQGLDAADEASSEGAKAAKKKIEKAADKAKEVLD